MEGTVLAGDVTVASAEDDLGLRELLRRGVMPGAMRVAFHREPSYFAGDGLAGARDTTFVHHGVRSVDAMARLSARTLYRNRKPHLIGYLSELRIETMRGSAQVLADGYELLRQHAENEGVDGCFVSVGEENRRARRVLERGGRLGIPQHAHLADLVTLIVPVPRQRTRGDAAAVVADRDELTEFLDRHARGTQLSLTWDDERWTALAAHGVGVGDFCVVRENGVRGRIVAAGAIWDQRAFRQLVIHGYSGVLRYARPLLNLSAILGAAPLPKAPAVLAIAPTLGAVVDHERHWPALVSALRASAARRGIDWFLISRDARDPQLTMLRRTVTAREYRTCLYDVRWNGKTSWPDQWNGSFFRPEVGLL